MRTKIIAIGLLMLYILANTPFTTHAFEETGDPIVMPIKYWTYWREIYQIGVSNGNNPAVFAKFGGSTSETTEYLYYFSDPARNLDEYTYLQETIDYYSTSLVPRNVPSGSSTPLVTPFQRRSYGGRNGLVLRQIATVLEDGDYPYYATCAGETNLDCEIDAIRPSIAILWFGINEPFEEMPASQFKAEYKAVLEHLLSRHVLPIIGTIGRNCYNQFGHDGSCYDELVAEYNIAIKALAQELRIPYIDFATVLGELPNDGLHPDMLHLSSPSPISLTATLTQSHLGTYGNNVRNRWVLETLHRLRYILGQ